MNTDRLKALVNIYMERKDDLTSDQNDVRNKWKAVLVCERSWNADAEDFGTMFERAMQDAGCILDEGESHPEEGIVWLCRNGKEEEVRTAFRDLIASDGGDFQARQGRVGDFVKTINAMLEELVPTRWDYRQRIRTAIRYLAIIRPNENYIFKASETAAFAGYCDVEDEIGYDKQLNLTNYYRMCDDVREYIGGRQDLLDYVNSFLEEVGLHGDEIDPAHHILVYDIISASYRLDFYTDKLATRKSKVSAVAQRRIDRTRTRAMLLDEREETVDKLDALAVEEKNSAVPDIVGNEVSHASFGQGKIDSQTGKYFTVKFEDGTTKKFVLPGAIVNGYITFDKAQDILDALKKMEDAAENRKAVEKKLTSIDVQLQMLEN